MGAIETVGLFFFIIGLSEYVAGICKHYGVKIKPFNCSWCLTFWFGAPLLHWYTWGIPVEVLQLFVYCGYLFITRQLIWRHLY